MGIRRTFEVRLAGRPNFNGQFEKRSAIWARTPATIGCSDGHACS